MKNLKWMAGLLLAAWLPHSLMADLVGPYTSDANTLFLVHFDQAAGGLAAVNSGTKGGTFYSVDLTSANTTTTPPEVTTMLGAQGYVNGATNFHLCMTNPAEYGFGYDYDRSGAYQGDGGSGTTPAADALPMTYLNMGNGGQTPWTLEALIQPTTIAGNQEIICTDSSVGSSRAFQFRISAGVLQFAFIGGGSSSPVNGTIPTTGNDAFVAGNWYHVASVYDGTNITLYWTLLNPTNGAAHVLGTPGAMTIGTTRGAITGPLVIGNRGRTAGIEPLQGCIDEVRISSVARGAGQMQFTAPLAIAANPVSQNVDYNQPVSFSVSASSLAPLSYHWRFNSNSIAGATNATYAITNVTTANAGYYDCVVTNTTGYLKTSAEARLVVGAANFIANRYSFTTSSTDPNTGMPTTPDSIGGMDGTNFGNAIVSGGQLVLDGSSGTYMQLPSGLFNSANATALTVEFWATFGANSDNVSSFAFGYTNYVIGSGIVAIDYFTYSPHNAAGQTLSASAGDPTFAQSTSAAGNLDGQTVHVACVMDPPNKTFAIYTNGILEAVNTNFTVSLANVNDQLSYVGKSLWDAYPYLIASIDELRIFKGALSSISIKQSQDQGPDVLLADGPAQFVLVPVDTTAPVGQPATFTATTVGYLPITYQWFKNGALIPGATNASYTYAPAISDNNATFSVHATNTIGVTTYVTNSAAATLTVFVPPTLAWVDASHGGSGNSTWDTGSYNWTNSVNLDVEPFIQTNGALFDDRGVGSSSVDVSMAIMPYIITVNSSSDYMLYSSSAQGSLNGGGSLTKLNSDTLTIDLTNNLTGPVVISAGTLQVGNGDSYGSLGSGPVTNNATLSFNRVDTTLAVGNAIHGTGTVNYIGSGSVTLTGNSDYSGGTFINSGIVDLASATGLGAASSGTAVNSGGQLYITGGVNVAEPLTLNGSGDGNGALRKGGSNASTESGAITLGSDSTISVDSGATLTLSNVVSGSAVLTVTGSGTLALSANNTFSGGLVLNGPTVVDLNASRALGTGPVTVSAAGHFVIGTGLTITNAFIASTVSPGTLTGLLMVNDNTNGTVTTISGPLEFDATAANGGNFVGPASSGYLNITGPVTNTATGTVSSRIGNVRFSGGGNYTTFVLNEGRVSIGANNGICPNASLTVASSGAATFDLNGFNQILAGLTEGGANYGLITNSAAGASTLTLNLAGSSTFAGIIGGNVSLVENGSSLLTLSGANTYTGSTTINGGTLELAQPTLAAKSTVTIASGAILQLDFATTNTVTSLVLNGVSQGSGVYNNTTTPAYLAGSGSLQVVPATATYATNITATATRTNLSLVWPADHTGWRLLVCTNTLAKGLSANSNDWIMVSGSDTTNQMKVTIDPTKPAAFYRLVYP